MVKVQKTKQTNKKNAVGKVQSSKVSPLSGKNERGENSRSDSEAPPLVTETYEPLPEEWIKATFDIHSHPLVAASCLLSPSVQ